MRTVKGYLSAVVAFFALLHFGAGSLLAQMTQLYHVVAVSGAASYVPSGSSEGPKMIRNNLELSGQDTVITGGNAHVVVIADDGSLFTISANCRAPLVQCLARFAEKPESSAALAKVFWQAVRAIFGGTSRLHMASASVRGLESGGQPDLVILAPRNASVATTRPVLKWKGVPEASSYEVVIYELGDPIWNEEMSEARGECQVRVPEGVLRYGQKYFWSVRANTEDSIFEKTAMFRTLPSDSVASLENEIERLNRVLGTQVDDWTAAQLKALLYSSYGLYNDALETVLAAAKEAEVDPGQRREFVLGLLAKMGVDRKELRAFESF